MEHIGKVWLDSKQYDDSDVYSDGDVEQELLQYFMQGGDADQLLKRDGRWPVQYHLHPCRQALLDWVDFPADAQVLEIGAGPGALTGLLCKRASSVTAIEMSLRRARINAYRHKDCENLKILVGDFRQMDLLEASFDYITVIGVLEYVEAFGGTPGDYDRFLQRIHTLLKSDGQLILAIENRFGLKYFAGAQEDHLARPYVGLEGYGDGSGIRTFGKHSLSALLAQNGFGQQDFYYPLPDYKFPKMICTEDSVPEHIEGHYLINPLQPHHAFFSESAVLEGLIHENQFGFFANSFLIFCRKGAL